MMNRKQNSAVWICTECGNETLRWAGKCEFCDAWNSLKQVSLPAFAARKKGMKGEPTEVVTLSHLVKREIPKRLTTNLKEVDRVLGGGLFPGTVALIAGEPGIGKSTLLISIAHALANVTTVLYLSGEESTDQILHRAERLNLVPSTIKLASVTDLEEVQSLLHEEKPGLVIIDSIQTLSDSRYPSAAGSMVQVRECALTLQRWTKSTGSSLILVGHVTKEGGVAGPKTLEHLVDVVISLEGERTSDLRLIRTQKNRFGPTDEVGILEMKSDGLHEVANPSELFIRDRLGDVAGSVITVVMEGRRPLLIEIQALTRPTNFAYPRRGASGFDLARLELIIAVLEARGGLKLNKLDCFVNVSGGLKIKEPAADLAVALALSSAATGRPLNKKLVAFGEIGLSGEIRRVAEAERRREEARRMGFEELVTARTIKEILTELGLRRS